MPLLIATIQTSLTPEAVRRSVERLIAGDNSSESTSLPGYQRKPTFVGNVYAESFELMRTRSYGQHRNDFRPTIYGRFRRSDDARTTVRLVMRWSAIRLVVAAMLLAVVAVARPGIFVAWFAVEVLAFYIDAYFAKIAIAAALRAR
jgi:hypothetical protein